MFRPFTFGPALAQSNVEDGALFGFMQQPPPQQQRSIGALDPKTLGLLGFASELLKASGPSPLPVGVGDALGRGLSGGINTFMAGQQANSLNTLRDAQARVYNAQVKKGEADLQLQNQLLQGGGFNSNDPDTLERLGQRLAIGGHPGAATLIETAQRMRTLRQNQQAVEGFRSTPGTLGAGVTVNSPQGRALLSNTTGDPSFDQAVISAQNDALNSNTRLQPQPVRAPQPGLFAPLLNSPYVGASAQSLQDQVNTSQGIPAQNWMTQFDRLAQMDQTARNQAEARRESGDLRREIAGQSDATRRDIANLTSAMRVGAQNDTRNNRTFTQENQLADDYQRQVRDFQRSKPHFEAATNYVIGKKFNSAGDRGLLHQYLKMLDPDDRIARGDLQDIVKLGGFPERFKQYVSSVLAGAELPERVRQEMFSEMRRRFLTTNEQQIEIENEYEERARRYMLNPSNVVKRFSVRKEGSGGGGPKVIDFNDLPRGARQYGGPVDANQAYVVGERGPEMFVPTQPGMIVPSGGFQSQVRALDNAQLDWHARSPDDPGFGERRTDAHWQTQAHIDHINARAMRAAELIKAGKSLAGTGYEDAPAIFDDWFGPGSFEADHLGRKRMGVNPAPVPNNGPFGPHPTGRGVRG